jgi:hypothetical protein
MRGGGGREEEERREEKRGERRRGEERRGERRREERRGEERGGEEKAGGGGDAIDLSPAIHSCKVKGGVSVLVHRVCVGARLF